MLKALFIGDPHFGKSPSYLAPGEWRKHVVNMLDAALENALRLKVHVLIVVGDIFDHNNPHPCDHAEFTDWVFRAKEATMQVIIIPGNHDYGDANYTALEPYSRMRDTVRVIKTPTTTKLKGIPVKFFPWSPPDVQHKIGDIKDRSPYLVIHHEEVKGAKMDNGWIADGFTPRKVDFLVGGHLHTHQLVGKQKRTVYVGTALPSHWNHDVQGFTYLTATMEDSKLVVQHEQIPYTPPFLLKEVTLERFLKVMGKREKVKTYYRVVAATGTSLPDDKRIVSRKFTGDKKSDKQEKNRASALSTLPSPMTWLVGRLPKDKQARAMHVLDSINRNDEED